MQNIFNKFITILKRENDSIIYGRGVCILLIHIEIGKETTASIVILKWYFHNQTTLMAAAVQEKFK